MRLVEADALGSIADYRLVERERPVAGPGEVLVRVATCGMGYVDALLATGGYQVKPPLPFTPGQEIGGVVEAVGAGVTAVAPGQRVMARGFGGGLAEYVALPAGAMVAIPEAMSLAQAAVFRLNYLTALHGLVDRGALQAGERLLVFGSAGGVGTAAVQIGRLLGAEVIAVASTSEKREHARANGAQAVLDTHAEGWRDRLKAATVGAGVDVVFDPVCGPLFEPAFRSLAWRGRHLVVGFVGGPFPRLPVNLPLMKGAALAGVDVRQFLEKEEARAEEHMARLLAWVGEGRLAPPVGRRYPLEDFAEAMTFALSGQGVGKVVIDVAPLA